jgi:hypothetical protein
LSFFLGNSVRALETYLGDDRENGMGSGIRYREAILSGEKEIEIESGRTACYEGIPDSLWMHQEEYWECC